MVLYKGRCRQMQPRGNYIFAEIDPGVSFRSAAELFRLIREERADYEYYVTVSLFEIYNEDLRDLLADPRVSANKKYEIKMGEKGYHIPELKTVRIESHRDVVDIMAQVAVGHRHHGTGSRRP